MDRRKQNSNSTDELAIIKAAAWAWYQHGSGSEGKTLAEFGITRTHHAPGPSRYKLEAMRIDKEARRQKEEEARRQKEEEARRQKEEEDSKGSIPIYTDNSLLDTFEVQSISKQLGELIESSSKRYGNVYVDCDQRKDNVISRNHGSAIKSLMKKKMIIKRFLLRNVAVVCGTKEDVVDATRAIRAIRQQERYVPVVNITKCRPQANHAL